MINLSGAQTNNLSITHLLTKTLKSRQTPMVAGQLFKVQKIIRVATLERSLLIAKTSRQLTLIVSWVMLETLRHCLKLIELTTAQAEQTKKDIKAHYEHASVQLAITLAREIIGHNLQYNETALAERAAEMITVFPPSGNTAVIVHPRHFACIGKVIQTQKTPDASCYTLEVDSSLELGEVVIRTTTGQVRLSLLKNLEKLEEHLGDLINSFNHHNTRPKI